MITFTDMKVAKKQQKTIESKEADEEPEKADDNAMEEEDDSAPNKILSVFILPY